MLKQKKGQLFTILTIMIIALMFISFEIYSTIRERDSIKTRVSSMDSFLDSIEANLQRQMYISGFRIIFLGEDYISTTGNYVNDMNTFFNEAFFNGTVSGVASNIMIGATYDDLVNSVNERAAKINVVVNMTNSNITISQDSPWYVKFEMLSNFVMEDRSGLARWAKVQNITAFIPVVGFEDPIYFVGSGTKYSKIISQTPYEGDYVSGGDYSNINEHICEGYYAANPDAPSFLDRLEGDVTTSSANGIESFVNTDFPDRIASRNSIDHLYFSGDSSGSDGISGLPSWVKLDAAHRTKYQV